MFERFIKMLNTKVISQPLIRTITPAIGSKISNSALTHRLNEADIMVPKKPPIIGILENSIQECLDAGSFNIAAKVKFHRILDKALPHIMTPENFINKGRESKVYRISDNYVAKIRRGKTEDNAVHFLNSTKRPSEKFAKLDFYYGEPLIKVGGVEILKNATPTSDFMKCGTGYKTWGSEMICKHEDLSEYYNKYLPLCASMPQNSFDEFAQGLQKLNGITGRDSLMRRVYYTPDTINPNNILIADNKFRVVDSLEQIHAKNPNTLHTMLEPLVIKLTPNTYAGEMNDRPEELIPLTRTIIKKINYCGRKSRLTFKSSFYERS